MQPAAGVKLAGVLPSLSPSQSPTAGHDPPPAMAAASLLPPLPVQPGACGPISRISEPRGPPLPSCQVSSLVTSASSNQTSPDAKPQLPEASCAAFPPVDSDTIPDSEESDKFCPLPNKRRRDSSQCQQVAANHVSPHPPRGGLVVIIKPTDPSKLITRFNPLVVKSALESVAPGGVLQVRPNYRLNLLAVDTRNTHFTERLLQITSIAKIQVHAYQPHPRNCGMGVIKGVVTDLSDSDIADALRQRVAIRSIRRLGQKSQSVLIVFATETTPEHVIIGYTRYRVFEYTETPTQCTKCQRFGHVAAVCTFSLRCARCAENHDRSTCGVNDPRCANCTQQHESTSLKCPVRRKENAITRVKTANKTDYKSAKAIVQHRWNTIAKQNPETNMKTSEGYTSADLDKDFPPLPLSECGNSEKLHKGAAAPQPPLEATYTAAPPDITPHISPVVLSVPTPAGAQPSPTAKISTVHTPGENSAAGISKSPHRTSLKNNSETTNQQGVGKVSSIILCIAEAMRTFLATFSSPEAAALMTLVDSAVRFLTKWL